MTRDIRHYVLSCQTYQKVKPTIGNIVPPLAMRKVTPHPFHTLIIDTVGPLPKSQGYKHLVYVMDQCSKYVIAWPTRDVQASSLVRQFHERIICVYGAPHRLLSDNGSAFDGALFEEMCKLYSIKHSLCTSYHPQTQGQTECAQKSVVTLLRAFVNDKQTNWIQYLPSVVWVINSTESQVVGTSPYMLIFGRLPLSPGDISILEPFDLNLPSLARELISQARDIGSNFRVEIIFCLPIPRAKSKFPGSFKTTRDLNELVSGLVKDLRHIHVWSHKCVFKWDGRYLDKHGVHLNLMGMFKYFHSVQATIKFHTAKING